MDLANLSPVTIKDGHPGEIDEIFFRDASKGPSAGTEVHLIVATTFCKHQRYIQHVMGRCMYIITSPDPSSFTSMVKLLHAHEGVGFFKGRCNAKILSIGGSVEPLEVIGSLASKAFLEPSFADLADGHRIGVQEGSPPDDAWIE